MAKFYGFEHKYGAHTQDENGNDIGTVHVFDTQKERNAWVKDGNQFFDKPGYREPYLARLAKHWPADFIVVHGPEQEVNHPFAHLTERVVVIDPKQIRH